MFIYFFGKTLLSEPIADESRWPPELILLREKFTAKSQLEIAQLQIKHEEEVSVFFLFSFLLIWFGRHKVARKLRKINKLEITRSISKYLSILFFFDVILDVAPEK